MRKQCKALKALPTAVLAVAFLAGCGRNEASTSPPSVGLHEAALQGNLEAVRQHIAAGSDLDQRDPMGGGSPLIVAATFGRADVARALIKAGANLSQTNNEGSTALHSAAFFCHTEIVEVLLRTGADKGVRNNAGATALESVSGPFEEVEGIYDLMVQILGPMGLQLDYAHIRATRPRIAEMLRQRSP